MAKFKDYNIEWNDRWGGELSLDIWRTGRGGSKHDLYAASLASLRRLARWAESQCIEFKVHETVGYYGEQTYLHFIGHDLDACSNELNESQTFRLFVLEVLANRAVAATAQKAEATS